MIANPHPVFHPRMVSNGVVPSSRRRRRLTAEKGDFLQMLLAPEMNFQLLDPVTGDVAGKAAIDIVANSRRRLRLFGSGSGGGSGGTTGGGGSGASGRIGSRLDDHRRRRNW